MDEQDSTDKSTWSRITSSVPPHSPPLLNKATLERKKHIKCLKDGLTMPLPKVFERLAPAQTWTVYWISHSLSLLNQQQFLTTVIDDVIQFIQECAHKDGGYGGGPGQIAHVATTFAAINALITLSSDDALESIDRAGIVKFLHRMKQPDGSFTMHDDGEIDSRSVYCSLAVLRCLNIHDPILLDNVADWVLSCQTYEGGFASLPGSEAHGGYTFCCVASLCLLNQLNRANLPDLVRWLTNKQMSLEGGFCGRSNKLVDSCYSYWQGAVFPMIHPYLIKNISKFNERSDCTNESPKPTKPSLGKTTSQIRIDKPEENQNSINFPTESEWLFDSTALQEYILDMCQASTGLLRDKPDAKADFYHTCYALSGLSISQNQPNGDIYDIGSQCNNILRLTHPLFNLDIDSLNHCNKYFSNKKIDVGP